MLTFRNTLTIVFLSLVLLVGCNGKKQHIREILVQFESKVIIVPPKMLVVRDGTISFNSPPSDSLLQYVLWPGRLFRVCYFTSYGEISHF